MLSFSNNPTPPSHPSQPFSYYTISNPSPSPNPPRIPNPKPKSIHPTFKPNPNLTRPHSSTQKLSLSQPQFTHKTSQPKLFDQKLKLGGLAAEQRRIQNQIRKIQGVQRVVVDNIPEVVEREVVGGNKNRGKSMEKRNVEKSEEEMNHLKRLIQKQKREKMKNDKQFDQKAQALNTEMKKLKLIQSQMKKVRNPNHPIPNQQQNSINHGNRPSYYPHPQHPTPSREHYIDGDQQRQRKKKQLALLMGRRQQLAKYSNPLKTTSTLIPLLSKTSYRIISTHISSLTELLIDDILLEQVLILEEIEQRERDKEEKRRQKGVLKDYLGQVGEMVRDNDIIENRIGNYAKLDFFEYHRNKPEHSSFFNNTTTRKYEQSLQYQQNLTLYLTNDVKTKVYNGRDKFEKWRKYRDEYEKENEKMFGRATEELIEEIVDMMVRELDKGSEEFVEGIFRNQFK